MKRRGFIKTLATAVPLFSWDWLLASQINERSREWRADLVVAGGGLGGCAAALAALRAGLRVILTENTDWIGGQATSQAVPPDEHPWIETFGGTRSYRQYRESIRALYRDHYPLTAQARLNDRLNPGGGWVSRLCHEPRVSLSVLQQMLAPYLSNRQLRVLLEHRPVSAEISGDAVRAITVQDLRENRLVTLSAPYIIDATELGDVLALAKIEHVTGAESRQATDEPHAPETANSQDQQAFTYCFAVDHIEGEDHTIEKPSEYDFWRAYQPQMQPPWQGPLFSWTMTDPISLVARHFVFDPTLKSPGTNLWTYRRLIEMGQFLPGSYRSDISLVNWPQNDYFLGPLIGVSEAEASRHLQRAKQLSLSLLYWLQTEAPRPDGGTGWKGLRLREDIVGSPEGLAKAPYIRESRRIQAEFIVREQHISTESRIEATGKPREEATAEVFPDSIGVGHYRIDLHPSASGRNYVDLSCLPFQIPLGALLPKRVENLLPAAKNIGTTHITNGAYRLHPVEWNIGESAGLLVAYCLRQKESPRHVRHNTQHLATFQQALRAQGVELEWPRLRPL